MVESEMPVASIICNLEMIDPPAARAAVPESFEFVAHSDVDGPVDEDVEYTENTVSGAISGHCADDRGNIDILIFHASESASKPPVWDLCDMTKDDGGGAFTISQVRPKFAKMSATLPNTYIVAAVARDGRLGFSDAFRLREGRRCVSVNITMEPVTRLDRESTPMLDEDHNFLGNVENREFCLPRWFFLELEAGAGEH